MNKLLPALLLTAACGAGLVDHDGFVLPPSGGGLQCGDLPQKDCGTGVCVNLDRDVNNCGACGFACATPQHATSKCEASTCGFTCNPGFFACASQGCCPASAIAAGGNTTCAVVDSNVECWGSNDSGQLAVDPAGAPWSAMPVKVPGVPAASSVAVGLAHACAILAGTGEVMCWGANESIQLGVTTGNGPAKVFGVSGAHALALGDHHSCALTDSGAVCWGANDSGQLGNGTTSPPAGPQPAVPNTAGATSLSAGGAFNCAANAGKLWCWGSNASGQIIGTPLSTTATPIENKSVSGTSMTAAGSGHACAIGSGFWCWGANSAGQVGNGSTSPTQFTNVGGNPTAVGAGALHTCALESGIPLCWGSNTFGQLGIGSLLPQLKPTIEVPLAGVQQLAVGSSHTCAQTTDGALYCWGRNDTGQVAAPLVTSVLAPRPID